MNPTDNLKYNRYQELPISELDVLVYVYQLPGGIALGEDKFGDTAVSEALLSAPAFSFYANISKLHDMGVAEAGGVKIETRIELICRTRDVEGIKINDILRLDLVDNPSYRIWTINRHEYRFGTILQAAKLSI